MRSSLILAASWRLGLAGCHFTVVMKVILLKKHLGGKMLITVLKYIYFEAEILYQEYTTYSCFYPPDSLTL